MYMLEIRKNMLDEGAYICAMMMDLSKTFHTINHDLMIRDVWLFTGCSSVHEQSTKNRQQSVRVNNNSSTWENYSTSPSMIFFFCFKFKFK